MYWRIKRCVDTTSERDVNFESNAKMIIVFSVVMCTILGGVMQRDAQASKTVVSCSRSRTVTATEKRTPPLYWVIGIDFYTHQE